MITKTIINILMVICACEFVTCLILIVKNEVTYHHHMIISEAIFKYHINCFYNRKEKIVNYTDMEDHNKTLCRLWDWTNKRILPKEKFEIIKPFIRTK